MPDFKYTPRYNTTINKLREFDVDKFTEGYIICACWSSTDEEGKPFDNNPAELSDQLIWEMKADCEKFQKMYAPLLLEAEKYYKGEFEFQGHMGQDFWLSRAGHGSGFLDHGNEPVWDQLQEAARETGDRNLYVGDDGLIYQCN